MPATRAWPPTVASGQREEQHLREVHAGALPQILDQLIERIVRLQFVEQFERLVGE